MLLTATLLVSFSCESRIDKKESIEETAEAEKSVFNESVENPNMPQPEALAPGTTPPRRLERDETVTYTLNLEADQYLRLVAEQRGADVELALFAPGRSEPLLIVDSPIGRWGEEVLIAVAPEDGEYRLEVREVGEPGTLGEYALEAQVWPATENDRRRAAAESEFAKGEVARRGKEYAAALTAYRRAQDEFQALGDSSREGDALWRLAWVHESLGEDPSALERLREAREVYRRAEDSLGGALVSNKIGWQHYQLGDLSKAEEYFIAALELARSLPTRFYYAEARNNLGVLRRQQGEVDGALADYEEALEIYRQLGEIRKEGQVSLNLGRLLLEQGRLKEAEDFLLSAAELFDRFGEPGRTAASWQVLGAVYKRQGKLAEAEMELKRAVAKLRQSGNKSRLSMALNDLGTVHLLLKDFPESYDCYKEALDLAREVGHRREEIAALVNLGRYHAEAKEPGEALEIHRRAAAKLAEHDDPVLTMSNLYGMGRAWHAQGDYAAARKYLEDTLETVEKMRANISSRGLRIDFFATRQQYYDLLIDSLMQLTEIEGDDRYARVAFEVAERRRARVLLESLGESADKARDRAPVDLIELESAAQGRLNELDRERWESWKKLDHDQQKELDRQLREARLGLESVRRELKNKNLGAPVPQPIDSRAIQKRILDRRTLLLAYALGEERSYLWLMTRDQIQSRELPSRREIESAARLAHRLLQDRTRRSEVKRRAVLEHLRRMLLDPVTEELASFISPTGRSPRLLIVSDGELLYLPFAVLPDPTGKGREAPLVENFEIVHLPSASVLSTLRQEYGGRPTASGQVAVFANPVFSPPGSEGEGSLDRAPADLRRAARDLSLEDLEPLEYSEQEGRFILGLAQGEMRGFFEYEASKEAVLSPEIGRYQILHFATHGLVDRSFPELSGLVFSLYDEEGRPLDGFLRLHEIYNLDLPAELVVLSACQTGLGPMVRGEGILGLTQGFMYAGVPRVVVSLWNIADQATAEFMKRFYWSLLEVEASPASALRTAQLAMLESEEWSHPRYWAGFVLQGEWRLPHADDDDGSIEGAEGGGGIDNASDSDYPIPDVESCDELEEEWQRKLCEILRKKYPLPGLGRN